MKIALIGYGKMGQAIEEQALLRGHHITARVSRSNPHWNGVSEADVAIEFTEPGSAVNNVLQLLSLKVPVVCGTTGWDLQKPMVAQHVHSHGGAVVAASNFSLGVNLFFALNQRMAQLLAPYPDYKPEVEEIHHIHKKDKPSGTALVAAYAILEANPGLQTWSLDGQEPGQLPVFALRQDEVPGTHEVRYTSAIDQIALKHTAFNRTGFALGAVIAAEWIQSKNGFFDMADVLNLKSTH
jgi:4-hydroxy-tetrahydrodipicolinate reductase